mmetsp:Transcript_40720/g.93658  ORF Transcript_40720/g.93658 Transcript_40720/m.93658 type:complete len:1192 (-) Transcript_40720:104-3679(-)
MSPGVAVGNIRASNELGKLLTPCSRPGTASSGRGLKLKKLGAAAGGKVSLSGWEVDTLRLKPGGLRYPKIAEEPATSQTLTDGFLPGCLYDRYGFALPQFEERSRVPRCSKESSAPSEEIDPQLLANCRAQAVAWMAAMGFEENPAGPLATESVELPRVATASFEVAAALRNKRNFRRGDHDACALQQEVDTHGVGIGKRGLLKAKSVRKLVASVTRPRMKKAYSGATSQSFEGILRAARGEINGRKPASAIDMDLDRRRSLTEITRRQSSLPRGSRSSLRAPSARTSLAVSAAEARVPKRSISFEQDALGTVEADDDDAEDDDSPSDASGLTDDTDASALRESDLSTAKKFDEASLFANLSSASQLKATARIRTSLKGNGRTSTRAKGRVRFGKPTLSSRLASSAESLIKTSKYLNGEKYVEADAQRFHRAYERFLLEGEQELPRDRIYDVCRQLGFAILTREETLSILDQVAPYATLDASEFMDFMQAYLAKEDEAVGEVFQRFDEDGSGDISADELMKFMVSLGFTPLQEMVTEAMELADKDGNGGLDIDEMRLVISNYRKFEGFTRAEVAQMEVVFDGFTNLDDENGMPVDKLAESLVEIFGAAHKELAANLQSQATHRAATALTGLGLQGLVPKQHDLTYQEFLQWARRLREAEIDSYRPLFAKVDADASGYIDHKELKQLLTSMGLTPLKSVMDRCIDLVDRNRDGEINFEEFVNLMGALRRTEGFADSELYALEEVFLRFDNDNSGEIDTLEIINVMRYLGFVITLDDAHRLVAEVDANESGAVDFREFLHMVRIWREHEIHCLQEVYDQHADAVLKLLPSTRVAIFAALAQVGHQVDETDQTFILRNIEVGEESGGSYCTFDQFLAVADKTRTLCAERRAKYASLTRSQIESCQTIFHKYLKDGEKEINVIDLADVLNQFGCPIKSKEEQQKIMRKVEEARQAARLAGVEESEICTAKGKISWWVFLQIAGWVSDTENVKRFNYELEVLEETDFTHGQVTRFHRIFEDWAKLEFMRSTALKPARRRSVTAFVGELHEQDAPSPKAGGSTPSRGIAPKTASGEVHAQTTQRGESSPMYGRRITASYEPTFNLAAPTVLLGLEGMCLGMSTTMGIHVKLKDREALGEQMVQVKKRSNPDFEPPERKESIYLDFPEFLFILRWMLNRNFAELKDVLLLKNGLVVDP